MEDNLSIIREFLAEYNTDTGSDLEIKDKQDSPVLKPEPVLDISHARKTGEATAKRKKPTLKVLQGGAKGEVESAPSVKNLPTPGGIALLLGIVLFILFAISKTGNGYTRLQLIWFAISGTAQYDATSGSSNTQPALPSGAAGGEYIPGVSSGPYNPFLAGHLGIASGLPSGG